MRLSIIVAVAENGIIGRANDLPWRLSADLRRFRQLTTGHAILMGRKTYESIGRPLPDRKSIVITRQKDYTPPGLDFSKQANAEKVKTSVAVAGSLAQAIQLAGDDDQAFVIGGATIYQAAIPQADRIHLTRVHAEVAGDVSFPAVDWTQWEMLESTRHEADDKNALPYSFEIYDRRVGLC